VLFRSFIDKTGEMAIQPQYDIAVPFSQGLAVVKVDGKMAYIDTTGKIIWQAPTAVAMPTVVVPDLVGLTPYDATHQLDLLGLQVRTQGSADPWTGRVDRQRPLAGTTVARGSTVVLSVSAGTTTTGAITTTTAPGN
jgi:hypothetical protein